MRTVAIHKRLLNIGIRWLYWPICRYYAHLLGDRPSDNFYRILCSFQFYIVHGYWPNLKNPNSFAEKLFHRMLYDRRNILTVVSDKLLVRNYVSERIGHEFLIPILWHGYEPDLIPFDTLPKKFVIKTNHGCGFIIIVKDKETLNLDTARSLLRIWLKQNFCLDAYIGSEWGYKNIEPAILIEQFIGVEDIPPVDYKFYCFHGRVEFLTVHYSRFIEHKTRSFDKNFQPYDFKYDFDQWDGYCEKPINFDKMVRIAELLSSDFDFIRVDLYNVNGKIYFGELTPYPGGVSTKFLPRYKDFYLGSLW